MANALTWGETPTDDDKLWGLLVHASTFLLPFGAAILLYLIYKDKSAFIRYHAIQSLVFQVIVAIIGGATCGFGLFLALLQLWLAYRAYQGEWVGYPLVDGIGR